MAEVIIRISLRYVAAFLVAKSFLTQDVGSTIAADADIIQGVNFVLGALVGAAAEFWYWANSRFGQPNEVEPHRRAD